MPSRKKHTNPFLLLIAIALCLVLGVTLRQSTADFSILEETSSSMTASSDSQKQDKTDSDQKENSAPSATASPTPAKKPSDSKRKVSDEAASGVWTSSGSNWLFMVDGKAHTGWLTDTDGKTYYFNQDGIMQTGWVDADGKRYYMDLDGIMQTGIITVDGKSYELQSDGSLKGYSPKESTPTSKPESDSSNSKENNKKDSDKKNSGKKDSGKKDSKSQKPSVKYAALTFDDGPSPNTTRILDILDQYGVKATFFTICSPGEENEESLKRIVSSGNTLAIHSVSHEYSQVYASIDSFKEDVLGMQQWLYEQTGVTTWFYRFPGGSSNKVANCDISDCINFLNEQGFVYFDWNVSSGDASAKCVDKDTIVQNVLSEIGSREEYVVLMHDAGAKTTTVEALPEIIEYLQANDYMILPITANTKPVQHRHS